MALHVGCARSLLENLRIGTILDDLVANLKLLTMTQKRVFVLTSSHPLNCCPNISATLSGRPVDSEPPNPRETR
jgi:hypothetical protein